MLGKGQSGGYSSDSAGDVLQSAVPLDSAAKKGLPLGGQLPGGLQAGSQQQNQQLLLTPASLQLAQLQAQLTLHRLKLAQGGNTAAATVLNQVLSNVAMAQPLFNQLRNPQIGFPTGVPGFPASNSALGTTGFNPNAGNCRPNHHVGGTTVGPQGVESVPTYPSDVDRRVPYNLGASAASTAAANGHYSVINTKQQNNVAFKQDFYGQDVSGQQAGFSVGDQNMALYNHTGQKDQWTSPSNLSQTTNAAMASDVATVWTARSRKELYNPEEPTSDHKFNLQGGGSSFGTSDMQGYTGYQPLTGTEDTMCSGTRALQPYQVNDYHAVTPTQLPHQCSICDKKVYNLKDWDHHVKGKLHMQNRMLYINENAPVLSAGASLYALGRPMEGALNTGDANSRIYPPAGQDISPGVNSSYLPAAAAMMNYPPPNTGFTSPQPESKPFPPRKATTGRVVHICNLPEGSCTENDVINLGIPFGKVTNYILMRSTHQAFLEMAYIEAAQAMVQYYQLTPASINNQKLLIRMSKRYQELQLKKPGKNVQAIILDIATQRERDETHELENYMPERARSRSPISRSLSPHSHSPSFTSCSSAHSPQAAPCRGQERGSNGIGPRQGSWDWSSHFRRAEDGKERDDIRRNGSNIDSDRPNDRPTDRWKAYGKPLDYGISRSADERGGDEGMRRNRDFPRGNPQGMAFNSYRNMEDNFYMRSDKVIRSPYLRRDTKSKRRNGSDYQSRSRHPESEMNDEPFRRTPDDKKQSSPCRGSRKSSRRCTNAEKHDSPTGHTDCRSKEQASPQSSNKPEDAIECSELKESEKRLDGGENTDDECWYPKNMEEFLTVDEVGGEDDSIIEPDLPELEEDLTGPKESAEEQTLAIEEPIPLPAPSLEEQKMCLEESVQTQICNDAEVPTETLEVEDFSTETNEDDGMQCPLTLEPPMKHIQCPMTPEPPIMKETRCPTIPEPPVINQTLCPMTPEPPIIKQTPCPTTPEPPIMTQTQWPTTPEPPVIKQTQCPTTPEPPVIKQTQCPTTPEPPVIKQTQCPMTPEPPFMKKIQCPTTAEPPIMEQTQYPTTPEPPIMKRIQCLTTPEPPTMKQTLCPTTSETPIMKQIQCPMTLEQPVTNLSGFPKEDVKVALEEPSTEDKIPDSGSLKEPVKNHIDITEQDNKVQDVVQFKETSSDVTQHKDSNDKKDIEAPSSSIEQDRVVIEHIIPLGVEFIEPRTGFFCKLCELFYTSEETAKMSHCRSTVHYRNLQKYLSQLAQESLHFGFSTTQ
ncbi:RNA-binding protein 20 isoform X1 [Nerophis ophidion]|uniref:RNA-binding protein 20 isoform X1 n=2 Tax=Nerophis ophidion TaxID=159077 RepID=UPI002ADF0B80|nr:RNA-binding protein 20 isoform X1 [Nerophis ophidion]